ncbi:uncharacterized protein LOC142644607 [Castanea sativa]|uniref:uncharacterized protein LOC142644607 n=1 Tax=Castanea sativa TaxID=21020 RepID=UPI003F650816
MQYNPADRIEFKKQIKELLEMKLIVASKSPHSSPAFLVENEAERRIGKKRMVINYKTLNKETIDDGYFLPKKEELLTLIRGKKFNSGLDCKAGFWQVRLDEESQLLTAFSCSQGQYHWKVVPFGLKQAPEIMEDLNELDIEIEETREEMRLLKGKLEHLLFKRRKMQRNLNKKVSRVEGKQSVLAVVPCKLTLTGKEKISVSDKEDYSSGSQSMSDIADKEEYPRIDKENPEKKDIENEPKEKSTLVPLGIKFRVNADYPEKGISFEQWKTFASIIRKDDGSKYLDNRFFSTDNGDLSKFNILAGMQPKLCYQLFLSGLIDNIYPVRNLAELEFFPYGFKKAVENYQKRALKNSDRELFLSVQSSLPWWDNNGEFHSPYCFVRLGTKNNNQAFKEPVQREELIFTEQHLEDLRAEGLFRIYKNTLTTISQSKEIRVNYKTSKVLMTSYFNKKMSDEDFKKFRAYKNYFLTNTLDADEATKIKFCEKVRKCQSTDHMCPHCISSPINVPTDVEMESQEDDPCEDV